MATIENDILSDCLKYEKKKSSLKTAKLLKWKKYLKDD
jgi:hypothetical protein